MFIAGCYTCGIFGVCVGIELVPKRIRISDTAKLTKISQLSFDYLPDYPTNHGWRMGFDGAAPMVSEPPSYQAATDSPIPGGISITNTKCYYLDYHATQQESLANLIEHYIRPRTDGMFYLRVQVSSRDGSQSKTVWLCHIIGVGQPHMITKSEWIFDVEGEILENGWCMVKIPVENEVAASFGKEGYVFQKLLGIRLRGSLSLSPITFYRIA